MTTVSGPGREERASAGPPALVGVFAADGEMADRIATFDWSSTPLDSISQWPQSLRTTVSIMLNTRYPMFLFWGRDATCLYNDAYRPSLGEGLHPSALGQRADECWKEIWHIIGPQIDAVMGKGEHTWFEDQLVPFDRSGYLEEIYFTYSYSPVYAESGIVGGTLVVCSETTEHVLAERRIGTLQALATVPVDDVEVCIRHLAEVTATNDADVAFALLYELDEDTATARLLAAVGVDEGDAAAPVEIDLDDGATAVTPWTDAVNQIRGGLASLVVADVEERCGPLSAGAWPEPPSEAFVVGLAAGRPSAFALVLGASPRKRLDAPYRDFFSLVAAQYAAAIARAQRHRAERERLELLAELDRDKTEFFTNVSHELRTPLTLVLGPLERVLARSADSGSSSPLDRRELETAHRNGERLLKLVNSLLDFARVDAERLSFNPAPVDVGALTAECVDAFSSLAADAGLVFEVDCESGAVADVDADLWEKIVWNLVANAIKYTKTGSVGVRVARDEKEVTCSVSDTGIGIAAAELPHIFERFRRVEAHEGRSIEGTGVGLALVQQFVAIHGGSVEVASAPGVGSTFMVRLPRSTAIALAVAADRPAARAAAYVSEIRGWLPERADDSGHETATADGITDADTDADTDAATDRTTNVLVVDDNADMRDYLRRILSSRWSVTVAVDGRAALEAARQRPPDLVVTDVIMPHLDGLGLVRAMREDDRLADVPVIMLSARVGHEAAIEGLDAGATDYLAKPFSVGELVSRVSANLDVARVRRERTDEAAGHARLIGEVAALTSRLNGSRSLREVEYVVERSVARVVQASRCDLHLDVGVGVGRTVDSATSALSREALSAGHAFFVAGADEVAKRYPELDTPGGLPAALAALPLTGRRKQAAGAMTLLWAEPVTFDAARRGLLHTVANAVAQAVNRARDFDHERAITATLQEALLPSSPPPIPGLDIAWRYVAATDDEAIGGDWYDVFPLDDDGLVAFVIGDVVGHGLGAAAAMGEMRHSMRAFLSDAHSPAEVLNRMNRLACRTPGSYATAACLVLDRRDETITWALAGHPPPLVKRHASVVALDAPLGTPLGVPGSGYSEGQMQLGSDDLVLLYTDGLIERRREGLRLDELVGWLGAIEPTDATDLIDSAATHFLADRREDDVAVVAFRNRHASD